ncbi:MAG: EamA family transporter [Marinifilaceae bacterium]
MNQTKGFIYGVLSSSTFGLIPLFALPVLKYGMDLESVMVYRFGLSTAILGLYMWITGHDMKITWRDWITLFFLGLFYGSTAIFLTSSYVHIPSGLATTIHFLYPVVVTALMVFLFKERLSVPILIAFGLALAGVFMLTSGEGEGVLSMKGLALVLITVFTYAIYIVGVNKSRVQKMDGLKLTFYVLLACTLLFLTQAFIVNGNIAPIPNWNIAGWLLLLAIVPTVVSDLTLVLAVQHIGSTKTAVLGCMEPVTAVLVGISFLGEHLGLLQIGGIVVILGAVTTIILVSAKK